MIIPNKLKLGDTIGVVAPSGTITEYRKQKFLRGIEVIKKLGFKVKFSENIYADLNNWGIVAGTPQEKANDIHKMVVDNEVKAIMCGRGGWSANSVLPYLDFNLIKQNPKIIIGFSDNGILVNAIHTMTGLITFYGSEPANHFGHETTKFTETEFIARFVDGYTGEVHRNSLWEEIRPGKAKGKLLAGYFLIFDQLYGLKYYPKIKNAILALEGYKDDLDEVYSYLDRYRQLGIWDKVKAVIVGYVFGHEDEDSKPKISFEHVLREVTKDYDFPIMKVRDFGHRTECTPLPIGVTAKIDTAKLSFKIVDKYVK